MTALVGALLVGCSNAAGGSSTPVVVESPTPDSLTQNYVALVHNFWIQEQAADVVSYGSNLAARVCLGTDPPGAPTKLQFIDPTMCRERAIALLAVHEKFFSDLATTPPPPKFAADDQAFRTQLPKTITDLKALISIAEKEDKGAVLAAATAYNSDMFPIVTDALNDVDPSVSHP
jgi:hypothetical protein